MNQIRIALITVLLLGTATFSWAQDADSKPPQQEQSQPEREAAPPRQDEAKPAKPEKSEKPENAKPSKDENKPAHEQGQNAQPGNGQQGHARPAGKSARIPDQKFKTSFGRPHSFAARQVIQTTTVVAGQTQFVYSGYTFIILDPWPSAWLYTDDCYIDYVDGDYFLLDAVHPGIRIALFVQG